jgi:hypothetical protein
MRRDLDAPSPGIPPLGDCFVLVVLALLTAQAEDLRLQAASAAWELEVP